jgi:hypothetical protein
VFGWIQVESPDKGGGVKIYFRQATSQISIAGAASTPLQRKMAPDDRLMSITLFMFDEFLKVFGNGFSHGLLVLVAASLFVHRVRPQHLA